MSVKTILIAATATLVLAGCSHGSHGGRSQYAAAELPPANAAKDHAPQSQYGAGSKNSHVAGKVIYEEPPRHLDSQELPPEILEEFRREFYSQPTSGSLVNEPERRGLLQRISARRKLPEMISVHETYLGHAPYVLDTGDRLRVTVFEQAELTGTYTVSGSGMIMVPLIGNVRARGRTTRSLARIIARRLAKDYVKDPKVTVEVKEYRPFFILGEVQAGGKYPYVHGLTVESAVAMAGGYGPRANQTRAIITRTINGRSVTAKVGTHSPVMPGDIVKIEERWF